MRSIKELRKAVEKSKAETLVHWTPDEALYLLDKMQLLLEDFDNCVSRGCSSEIEQIKKKCKENVAVAEQVAKDSIEKQWEAEKNESYARDKLKCLELQFKDALELNDLERKALDAAKAYVHWSPEEEITHPELWKNLVSSIEWIRDTT